MNHRSKKIISYAVSLAVVAAAVVWIGGKFVHLGNVEFTDNAQVRRQIVPVKSRVPGYFHGGRCQPSAHLPVGSRYRSSKGISSLC